MHAANVRRHWARERRCGARAPRCCARAPTGLGKTPRYWARAPSACGCLRSALGTSAAVLGTSAEVLGTSAECVSMSSIGTGNELRGTGNELRVTGNELRVTGNERPGSPLECRGRLQGCRRNPSQRRVTTERCPFAARSLRGSLAEERRSLRGLRARPTRSCDRAILRPQPQDGCRDAPSTSRRPPTSYDGTACARRCRAVSGRESPTDRRDTTAAQPASESQRARACNPARRERYRE